MKKILFLAVLSCLAIISCNKDESHNFEGKNKLIYEFVNTPSKTSAELEAQSNVELKVRISVTKVLSTDSKITVESADLGEDKLLKAVATSLELKKGERDIIFTLIANPKTENISASKVVELTFKSDNAKVEPLMVKVTITENKALKALSERDRKLISHYIKTYNLDLLPLLGKWTSKGSYTLFYNQDGDLTEPLKPATNFEKQSTIISLSPLATEDKPILAMENNAFGLKDYFRTLFEGVTLKNPYWNPVDKSSTPPASSKIMTSINFNDKSEETYDVAFYNMEIEPNTKQIKADFLKNIREIVKLPRVDPIQDIKLEGEKAKEDNLFTHTDEDELKKKYMPFVFIFSPWERAIQYLKEHTEDSGEEGGLRYAIKTGSFCPYQILNYSTVDRDGWKEDDPKRTITNFVAPKLLLNMEKKEIELTFCNDMDGGLSTGYNQVNLKMTKAE